eukprot:TRINITY_DN5503_c0_g1_i1.p1 TRINITY_DN5503_c0_g1~~TRINITY_DN5503_c0_g1_i1.p1  ORF type:complete len:545 (-),score=57.83 TRINITY_DN5503_c0_g1_i1:39-1673(-)
MKLEEEPLEIEQGEQRPLLIETLTIRRSGSSTLGSLITSFRILLGLFFFVLFLILRINPQHPKSREQSATLGITLWLLMWWLAEPVPLQITALLPLVLFPVTGVLSVAETAAEYANNTVFLMAGGFMLALAAEKWKLLERIAFKFVLKVGFTPHKLLLGLLCVTSLLSAWMANAAAAVVMVPITVSIMEKIPSSDKLKKGFLLAVAYGSSIAGIITPIGSPPNIVVMDWFSTTYPDAPDITFLLWMATSLPTALLMLSLLYLYISSYYITESNTFTEEDNIQSRKDFKKHLEQLGMMSWPEKVILCVFGLAVFLWIFRSDLIFSGDTCVAWRGCLPGWGSLFPKPHYIRDGSVSIFCAILLFLIPARNESNTKILDWDTVQNISWAVLWLTGGGFALARAIEVSGLAHWIGSQLILLTVLPPQIIVVVVVIVAVFVTEIVANTPAVQIALPILAGIASEAKINPKYFCIPAAHGVSCAFMLPTATGPNSIIFSYGIIKVWDMVKAGALLNVISVISISFCWFIYGQFILGAEPYSFPDWAKETS